MMGSSGTQFDYRRINLTPSGWPRKQKMVTAITDRDRGHMNSFPVETKMRIMQNIMAMLPVAEWNFEGNNNYVKVMLKLRTGGLGLIDLQPQETAFTTVWYSNNRSLLGRVKTEVAAMVVWEFNGDAEGVTTLRVWHI